MCAQVERWVDECVFSLEQVDEASSWPFRSSGWPQSRVSSRSRRRGPIRPGRRARTRAGTGSVRGARARSRRRRRRWPDPEISPRRGSTIRRSATSSSPAPGQPGPSTRQQRLLRPATGGGTGRRRRREERSASGTEHQSRPDVQWQALDHDSPRSGGGQRSGPHGGPGAHRSRGQHLSAGRRPARPPITQTRSRPTSSQAPATSPARPAAPPSPPRVSPGTTSTTSTCSKRATGRARL